MLMGGLRRSSPAGMMKDEISVKIGDSPPTPPTPGWPPQKTRSSVEDTTKRVAVPVISAI